jgi:microcompartment protein CcmK/EutM
MQFARVRGTAICTIKYPGLEGLKLMVIEPVDKHLQTTGPLQIAVDVVQAGPGDICVTVASREAALAMPEINFVPVDLALVGVIDELALSNIDFDLKLKKGWNQYT